jgi:16S rRNA (cytosine967-C5)-methyltransferase
MLAARIAENQAQFFLRLCAALRPHWRADPALPARLQKLLAANPAFGARDRRLYRELVFTTLRFLPWIEPWLDRDPAKAVRRAAHLAADTKDTRSFRAPLATGDPPAGDRAELLPAWFRAHCPEIFSGTELEAQLARAPLWLRLQTDDPEQVFAELNAHGWTFSPSAILPDALRVATDTDVTKTDAYRAGLFEVQDLGSQMLLVAAPIAPGTRWLDACAGAGGKTLQLARLLGPTGHVDAHDIRPAALAELEKRAVRACHANAQLANIRLVPRPSVDGYDGVLVDAPCSGSGTWRRAPHLKWATRPADPARHAARQLTLLREFAAHVRPGGLLVYATCSLSRVENGEVAAAFLAVEKSFVPAPLRQRFDFPGAPHTLSLLPARHDTDGFFVAAFRRS